MSNKNRFLLDLEKVEDLDPEHLVIAFATQKDGNSTVGVVDYDGNKGDFSSGMSKILALHRASIVVVKDHSKITEAINQLLEISVSQERRISALESELERVRSEKIAVAVQDQAKSLTENLADRGYSTGTQKFTVKIEEEADESSHSKTEKNSHQTRNIDVKGKIKGLAKILAGLDVGVNVQRDSVERELDESVTNSSQSKKVNLVWEIASVTPPDDPRAHAHAYQIRQSEPNEILAAKGERFWCYVALISIVTCIAVLVYGRVA